MRQPSPRPAWYLDQRVGPHAGENAALFTRLTSILASDGRLRLAIVFGSATTTRFGPTSDLDVAVRPAAAWTGSEDLSLQSALTLAAGREVDLIRLDEASTLLKWQIAKSGMALHEARPGEFARFRAHAAGEFADFAPSFERHAEVFRRRLIEQGKPT